MADTGRTAPDYLSLFESLRKEPHGYDFFQALRRLECVFADRPRLGESLKGAEDAVRLSQATSLCFAPSAIHSFEPGKRGRPPRLAVLFLGLFGPNGPLPLHFTEFASDRARNSDDFTLSRFADVFHHRALSLFYRAWADAQPVVQLDRPDSDRFALYVGSLMGLGPPAMRERDAAPDHAKLYNVGHYACQTRHASGLESILGDYFRISSRIEQFVGQWLELPSRYRCRLGASPETGTLGRTAIAGSRIWDCQQKFRIVLGPMSLDDYLRLLPDNESMESLVALVRNYIGYELTWDLQLVLRKEEIPPLKLGGDGGARLGWTTWLVSAAPQRDADQLYLQPAGVS